MGTAVFVGTAVSEGMAVPVGVGGRVGVAEGGGVSLGAVALGTCVGVPVWAGAGEGVRVGTLGTHKFWPVRIKADDPMQLAVCSCRTLTPNASPRL